MIKTLFLGAKWNSRPANFYFQNDKNIYLLTEDNEKLGAYFQESKYTDEETRYYIICHGKGIDRHDAFKLSGIESFTDINASFLILDYRGFGDSTGDFSYEGSTKDLSCAYEYLIRNYDAKKIFIVGHSFGCSVALQFYEYLLSKNSEILPNKLFLFAPLISLKDLLNEYKIFKFIFNYLPRIGNALINEIDCDNYNILEKIQSRIVIFHGQFDEVIKFNHSLKIKEKFSEIKLILAKEGHNKIFGMSCHWNYIFKNSIDDSF